MHHGVNENCQILTSQALASGAAWLNAKPLPCFAGLFTARELIYVTTSSTPKLQKPFTLVTHGSSLELTTQQTYQRIGLPPSLLELLERCDCRANWVHWNHHWRSHKAGWRWIGFRTLRDGLGCSLAMRGCSIYGGIYVDTGLVRPSYLPHTSSWLPASMDHRVPARPTSLAAEVCLYLSLLTIFTPNTRILVHSNVFPLQMRIPPI